MWTPAKTQISMRIRPVWSVSSQGMLWVAKDPKRLQPESEDSDQPVYSLTSLGTHVLV